jgi:hypothetical protein
VSAATLRHSRCIDSSQPSCVHVATLTHRFITIGIYLMHVSTSSRRRLCRQQRGVARTRSARSGSRWNWWLGTSWKIYRRRELAKRRGVGRVCDPVWGVILGVILGVPEGPIWGSPGGVLGGPRGGPAGGGKMPPREGDLGEFPPRKNHLERFCWPSVPNGRVIKYPQKCTQGPPRGPPGRPPGDPPLGPPPGGSWGGPGGVPDRLFWGSSGPPKTSANPRPCVVRTQQAESKADPRRSKSRSSATILTRSRLSVDIGTRCRWSSR